MGEGQMFQRQAHNSLFLFLLVALWADSSLQKVGTRDPTPKSWHSWPHHLTTRATKRPFPWSRSQKKTSFRRKKKVARCGAKILHSWPHPKSLHSWPHALTPRAQKGLFKGRQGQQELIFRWKTVFPHREIFTGSEFQSDRLLFSIGSRFFQ